MEQNKCMVEHRTSRWSTHSQLLWDNRNLISRTHQSCH